MNDEVTNSPAPITSHLAKVSYKLGLTSLLSLSVEIVFICWALGDAYALPDVRAIIALASMVTAFGTGLAAVVFAYAAARRIKKSPASLTGLDLVMTGRTGGSMGAMLTVFMFFMLPYIANYNGRVRVYTFKEGCISNLRQIEGAKEQWALEQRKTQTDTPTMNNLVGTDKYIKVTPTCPANGTYTIGKMTQRPKCSISDHTLP